MKAGRSEKVRTFIAVVIDERVRRCVERYVAGVRASLQESAGGVRWVAPSQYHFTLRFLGDLDEPARGRVFEAVALACRGLRAFEVRMGALGAFPDLERPRVLWLGVEPPGEAALRDLASRVEAALVEAGLGSADRPFSPHLTVGRVKEPWARAEGTRLQPWLSRSASECGPIAVDRVVVMASQLTRGGPIYTPLLAVSLEGGSSR